MQDLKLVIESEICMLESEWTTFNKKTHSKSKNFFKYFFTIKVGMNVFRELKTFPTKSFKPQSRRVCYVNEKKAN